jgi:hypothetical protein
MVLYPSKFRGPYMTSPGIGTHSYTVSSSWEECSAFSAADAMLQFFPLSFHQVPVIKLLYILILANMCSLMVLIIENCPLPTIVSIIV